MIEDEAHRAIDAVWRIESARLIAGLARIVRDVGLAEDLAQDALMAALQQWPESGVPENPGAWLMAVGRRRAIDLIRRRAVLEQKQDEIGRELVVQQEVAMAVRDAAADDDVGDDLLRLVFVACHPVLSTDARVALDAADARRPDAPTRSRGHSWCPGPRSRSGSSARSGRSRRHRSRSRCRPRQSCRSVLPRSSGSSTSSSTRATRPRRATTGCDRGCAKRRCAWGGSWPELMPAEPEAHGLVALMEIQASRMDARVGPGGDPILLLDQDRSRWDQLLIRRGLAALDRASALGGGLGPYGLQAAIAACHARARTADETDWPRISALYDALAELTPSPVVELNRAVAVSMAFGPAAGLELVDRIADDPALRAYHLLPSVRGDLLAKLGRHEEAAAEFERAAAMTRNLRERELLQARAVALDEV